MLITKKHLSDQTFFVISVAAILIYQFLWIFHGFDVCDEGWYMTFYQQIFHYPEGESFNFLYWFTGIVGGLWYKLNPLGGIISFRILGVIVITLTYILSYKVLKDYFDSKSIIAGLFFIVICFRRYPKMFLHNTFTSLLIVSAVLCLIYGIKKYNLLAIGFSGMILAFNSLARLPNILILSLVAIIPLYTLLSKEPKKLLLKKLLFFTLGVAFGFSIIYFIMYKLGHISVFTDTVKLMLSTAQSSESTHGISNLIRVYSDNYYNVIVYGSKIMLLFTFVVICFGLINNKTNKLNILLYGIILLVFYRAFEVYTARIIFINYFVSISVAIVYLLKKWKTGIAEAECLKIIIIAAAMIMLVVLPLGSDGGIGNMGPNCLWLAFPISCSILVTSLKKNSVMRLDTPCINIHIITNKLLILLLLICISGASLYCIRDTVRGYYFDSGNIVLHKKSRINSKYTNYIFTGEKRANIINTVLDELSKHVRNDDYLLCYDSIPMIHYLTETRPYIFSSWPATNYTTEQFERQLKRAEMEIPVLPTIVVQKFWTIGEFNYDVDYFSEKKASGTWNSTATVKMLKSFMMRHNYVSVWSNDYFEIFKVETE